MARRLPDAAIYQQIAEELRARIADGTLQPGQRIGSIADLRHRYDVGQGTVVRVLTRLRFEGLIVGRPGEVPRVAETVEPVRIVVHVPAVVSCRPATADEADSEQGRRSGVVAGSLALVVDKDGEVMVYPAVGTMLALD